MRKTSAELAGVTGWTKAEASGAAGHCLEAATLPDGGVAIRNSNHRDQGGLAFTRAEWDAFVDGAARGDFAGI